MSPRGPDPKEIRASLVDSGWSLAKPETEETEADDPSTRRLPNYEDQPQSPAVTRIDSDIQARIKAMQRNSLSDSQIPPLPPPPPARVSKPPPSLPPPPPRTVPPSAAPAEAPLPRFSTASGPDTEPQLSIRPLSLTDYPPTASDYPLLRGGSEAEPAEPTEIIPRADLLPPSDPPAPKPIVVRASAPAPAPPPSPSFPAPSFEAPAPLPRFAASPSLLPAAPSVLAALRQRVHFAGGEVPLWSLLTPMVVLLALGSAFAAAAVSSGDTSAPVALASASATTATAPSAPPSAVVSALAAAPEAPATTAAPALPASAIDTEALAARRAEELSKDEALALSEARRQHEVAQVSELRKKLRRDPGLYKDPATLAELRRAAEDPLTAPDALGAMADAPGSLSADLLYEMWTGTVARNSATELARSLVFSKEVRAKASPELAVALDLRIAETCEQNRDLLPKVLDHGDRRSLGLLAKLSRKFGCGPNKRLDCYACLRDDPKAVDDAMAAVRKRREPKPFAGK